MNPATGSYLDRYDAASLADKFPLVRGWMDNEPLPFFKELRERRPILVTPECTLVPTTGDAVRAVGASCYIRRVYSAGSPRLCPDSESIECACLY